MSESWLSDIIIVVQGDDELSLYNAEVFRSVGQACSYLEHWWVEDGCGFAFTAVGQRLNLSVQDRAVIVTGREDFPNGEALVLGWLKASAKHMLDARRSKAGKRKAVLAPFEERAQLPNTVEGLIAYIGFVE